MATGTKTARYDMLTNVPVTMDIKYVDVWPDRNGYGSQVSVKGQIEGETQTIYLKGKTWANLKALAEAGVIAGYEKEHEEPAEKVNLPVVNGHGVTLCRKQGAGEKFPTLTVDVAGGAKAAPKATTNAPAEFGRIPGLDDVDTDEPPPIEQAYEQEASPRHPKLAALFSLYDECYEHAFKVAQSHGVNEGQAISAMTSTLFIAAKDRGLAA